MRMSEQGSDTIDALMEYGDAEIKLEMDWEPGYLILKAIYRKGERERIFNGVEELLRDRSEEAKVIIQSHILWLMYNFNREMSLVKNEGMALCDKINVFVEAMEDQLSPSLLAVAYNPDRKDVVLHTLKMFIDGLNEIADYMAETVPKHCKRLSKFLKGLNFYRKNEWTRGLVYEIYTWWLQSDLRKRSLEEYRDYGLKDINKRLIKVAPFIVKKRLMEISADPFEKINFLAAINLRICDDSSLYLSILNSSTNLIEYIYDSISKLEELDSADVDRAYERLSDVADELSKLIINIRSVYMNLEPL